MSSTSPGPRRVPPVPPMPPPVWRPGPDPYLPPPGPGRLTPGGAYREWPTVRQMLGRVPGCLLVPFIFLFLGMIPYYALIRFSRRHAYRLFSSLHHHHHDPALSRAKKIRFLLALASSGVLLATYGSDRDLDDAYTQAALQVALAPWLLAVTTPVVVMVLLRYAPAPRRAAMRAATRGPLRLFGLYLGAVTLLVALCVGIVVPQWFHARMLTVGLVALALTLPIVWLVFFLIFASMIVARSGFGSAEVHPALPALLTGVLVWEFSALNTAMGGLPPGPPGGQVLILLSGPVTVSALAWWEIHRLRTRYGVRLRG